MTGAFDDFEGLGDFCTLPAGWRTSRLDRVATVNARIGWRALTAAEYRPEGYAFLATPNIKRPDIEFENVNYISRHRYDESPELQLAEGDVLLAKDGNTLGVVNVVRALPRPATVNGSIAVLRPFGIHPGFLRYVIASSVIQGRIRAVKDGMGVPHLFQSDIRRFPVPLPPWDEQCRIAGFLDTETARLDELHKSRARQVAVLRERELACIHARFAGTDETEEAGGRTATGWRWLPSVPDGWRVAPVYSLYDVQLGKMLNVERTVGANLRPYLRNANVSWYSINTSDLALMDFPPSDVRRYSVVPGDLLVCEGGAGVAEAAVWSGAEPEIFYQKSLHRVRPRSGVPVEWLMYWLRIAKAVGLFDSEGNVATIPHLTGEQLRELRIPVPPNAGRRAAEISREIEQLKSAAETLRRAGDLALERRQALITAAVTGQIDVRTAGGGR